MKNQLAESLHNQKINITIPEDVPLLGLKKGELDIHEIARKVSLFTITDMIGLEREIALKARELIDIFYEIIFMYEIIKEFMEIITVIQFTNFVL